MILRIYWCTILSQKGWRYTTLHQIWKQMNCHRFHTSVDKICQLPKNRGQLYHLLQKKRGGIIVIDSDIEMKRICQNLWPTDIFCQLMCEIYDSSFAFKFDEAISIARYFWICNVIFWIIHNLILSGLDFTYITFTKIVNYWYFPLCCLFHFDIQCLNLWQLFPPFFFAINDIAVPCS
jgi:hypothetical protein